MRGGGALVRGGGECQVAPKKFRSGAINKHTIKTRARGEPLPRPPHSPLFTPIPPLAGVAYTRTLTVSLTLKLLDLDCPHSECQCVCSCPPVIFEPSMNSAAAAVGRPFWWGACRCRCRVVLSVILIDTHWWHSTRARWRCVRACRALAI